MKRKITYLLLFILASATALVSPEMKSNSLSPGAYSPEEDYYATYKGRVIDAETKQALIFATVVVQGSNISTVTNIDGEFLIKVPLDNKSDGLEFSYIGYSNKTVPFSELREDGFRNTISLDPARIQLQEVIVRPVSPEEVVSKTIESIRTNYVGVPNLMTAFYRETIRKNRNYVAIGEAVVQVFKASYTSDMRMDAIRIYKGRKGTDVSRMDTVLFKLQGGPVSSLYMDIIKNPESIMTIESMKYYDYAISNIIMIDDNPHYIVEFEQKPEYDSPLFRGRLFIDTRNYALKESEFSLNLTNIEEASAMFIRKKPLGMTVTPEVANYKVIYRESDGKYYFSYSRAEVRFKLDWARKLFKTTYTTMTEIAITDRTSEDVIRFAGKERVKFTDIFSEKVSAFTDPDFWGDYNVIEPDQSIESAIRRLSRRLRVSDLDEDGK